MSASEDAGAPSDDRDGTDGHQIEGSGGELCVRALERFGVDTLFTLSGGHIFPIYDGVVKAGLRLVDTRHEQTATFAAEGYAKLTREPGVAVLTAGPGVTNGVSAVTTAHFNGSPLVVIGGRAPEARWGAGSLQEFDHVPVMAPVTKHAETLRTTDSVFSGIDAAVTAATTPSRGPAFVDVGMDVLFGHAEVTDTGPPEIAELEPDPADLAAIADLLDNAERPVFVAGTGVYFETAWEDMRHLVEAAQMPVFMNGLGRGTLPADHPLAFSRARSLALREADLVIVAGTPLDFRLGFGNFGSAQVVHVTDSPERLAGHVELAASAAGGLGRAFAGIAGMLRAQSDHSAWLSKLAADESAKREADEALLTGDATPIHPARVYGALREVLDRDAVVICDGGDFVSYAGKYVDSYGPGLWLDPGPYGCLGTALGYGIAARVAYPERQVVLLVGDGAFGFSGMDFDTLVRHRLPVVAICGNNGIWGLEKHPMQALYGYDVAAELQPECRYDKVVTALGGHGEFVTEPGEIRPAIERAFASGLPALVNVACDPSVAYPRSSNLA